MGKAEEKLEQAFIKSTPVVMCLLLLSPANSPNARLVWA